MKCFKEQEKGMHSKGENILPDNDVAAPKSQTNGVGWYIHRKTDGCCQGDVISFSLFFHLYQFM